MEYDLNLRFDIVNMGGFYHLAHDVVRLLSCAFDLPTYCLTDIFFFF